VLTAAAAQIRANPWQPSRPLPGTAVAVGCLLSVMPRSGWCWGRRRRGS